MKRRKQWLYATLAVSVLLLAGCSGAPEDSGSSGPADGWEAIVAAAKKEGSVTIHSGNPDEVTAALKEAFEKKYPGITLNTLHLGSSELIAQTEAAQKGNPSKEAADVIAATVPSLMMGLDKAGDLVAFRGPEWGNLAPTLKKYPLLQRSPNTLAAYAQPYYIVWNTDEVTQPVQDYSDLLDRAAEFKGNFGSMGFTAAASNFFAVLEERMDGVDLAKEFADTGKITGGQFLKRIGAELKPKIYNSGVPLTQAVASGEIKVGWFGLGPTIQELKASGAPIGYTLSKKAPTAATYTIGVPTWAPHPNAAQVLADFMMSVDGQAALTGSGNQSILENVPGSGGGPDDIILLPNETLSPEFVKANLEHVKADLTGQ